MPPQCNRMWHMYEVPRMLGCGECAGKERRDILLPIQAGVTALVGQKDGSEAGTTEETKERLCMNEVRMFE